MRVSSRMDWFVFLGLLVALCCCVDQARCQAPGTPIEYHTEEELPAGSMVGNITRSAGITDPAELQEMKFSLSDQRDRKWDLFTVDAAGILRTTKTIDRDKICAQEDVCAVDLRIIVQPIKYFRVIKVTVYIDDRNDNPPTFPRHTTKLSLSETTAPETGFSLPAAEDLDSTGNGVDEYRLNPNNGPFRLDVQDTAAGDVVLKLILQQRLDREKEESYTMWVTAMDRGQPQLTGSMLVQVKVLDANDNNPKFENDTYKVMLPENIPVGTTILKVTARDEDVGDNGEIDYSFSDTTIETYGDVFEINPETGEISVIGEIDYEKFHLYQLTAIARDRGKNSLPAYAKVDIEVEDLNDHAPLIVVNTLTPSGNAQVSEGSAVGIFVAHVQVSDPDGGDITCSMDSDLFGLQAMANQEYKVVTKAVFDREEQSEYHLNLVCQDRGLPPMTSTKYIPVTVTDENDKNPVFTQDVYNRTIPENNPIGLSIFKLSTTDEDLGRNAEVVFEVHGANNQILVDRITGVVTANVVFDYEETKRHEYLVVAMDQGDPPRTSTATLIIDIEDENDNPPVFTVPKYVFSIAENTPAVLANVKVGQVMATDADSSPFNTVTYSLEETDPNQPSNFSKMFSIDPDTGTILLKQMLDREVQEIYSFSVRADNRGYVDVSSLAGVEIHVTDINDNPPVVHLNTYNFTLEGNNTIRLTGELSKGQVVATISATDDDTGGNAAVSYTLVNISNNLFKLDTGTGDIILNANLVGGPLRTTTLIVDVSDKGFPRMTITAELKIIVNQSAMVLVPAATGQAKSFWNTKSYFAIGIAATCLLIIILAVTSVVVVKRTRKVKDKRHTYNCRLEAEKTTPNSAPRTDGAGGPPPGGAAGGKHNASFEGDLKEPERVTVKGVELGESCTDEGWSKAKENPYVLDHSGPKLDHNEKRDSGIELKVDLGTKSCDTDPAAQRHLVAPQHHPPTYARLPAHQAPLKEMELQVQDMLHILLRDKESPSETGSYTDSGKGPSEEGDHSHSWPDCHVDSSKGLPTVVEAHALAMIDHHNIPHHGDRASSCGAAPGGSTGQHYGGFNDDGIYVEAIPRDQVYGPDEAKRRAAGGGPPRSRLALPIPSYTPPPSYHDSVSGPKRLVRFASYNHPPPPPIGHHENSLYVQRAHSDSASWSGDQSRDQEELYASVCRPEVAAPYAARRHLGGVSGKRGHGITRPLLGDGPYSGHPLQRPSSNDGESVYDRLAPLEQTQEEDSGTDMYTSLNCLEAGKSGGGGDLGSRREAHRNKSRCKLHRTQAERLGDTSANKNGKKSKVQFWDEGRAVDRCVRDVVARYIPDRCENTNNHCQDPSEGFSDDDVTTESGSYVIDSDDIRREKGAREPQNMYVDYIVV